MLNRRCRATAIVTFVAWAAVTMAAQAAKPDPKPLDDVIQTLFAGHIFDQAAIAPDGKHVAWVENLQDAQGTPNGKAAIWVATVEAGAKPRRISAGTGDFTEYAVAWSPDSRQLAFLSDAESPGQLELFIIDLGHGAARRLTDVRGYLDAPGFSPDGKMVAVLFTENATRASGPLVAETPQTGVIQDAVTEQRLALVPAAGGPPRSISPANMYVYEYDWSPDGTRFVTTAAPGNGDDNWYIAQLYVLPAAGGEMKSIYKPPLQIAMPAWSPDGKSVAFIGGLMSDEPSVGGDVFVVPASGGEARNVTPGMKASASWLKWRRDGKIVFGEWIDGGSGLATVEPASGKIETLWQGADEVRAHGWGTMVSLADDGNTSAIMRESFSRPPEIWAGPTGAWKQITSRNAELKPKWGEAKSVHWTNEGFELQGWLLYPRDFDANEKYPLVVSVHGGPGLMAHPVWPTAHSYSLALAGDGYFVFFPNPRGSLGAGEKATQANVKDFGYGDWRDIMTGIDAVLKQAPVDERRLGLTGWSYGGYMTMWGVTQTQRFGAAVAGAGLANFQSYYGENQIDKWMIPFFGATVYDDPAVYARSSPITFVKQAKTPTLVVVGDSDGECPTPQSYEFWHALKTLGVETQLVVYEHEGHMIAAPEHQRDIIERAAAWFDQHLKAKP